MCWPAKQHFESVFPKQVYFCLGFFCGRGGYLQSFLFLCPGLNEHCFTLERLHLLLGLLLDGVEERRDEETLLLPFSPRFKDLKMGCLNSVQGMILSYLSRVVPAFTRGQLSPSLLLTSLQGWVWCSQTWLPSLCWPLSHRMVLTCHLLCSEFLARSKVSAMQTHKRPCCENCYVYISCISQFKACWSDKMPCGLFSCAVALFLAFLMASLAFFLCKWLRDRTGLPTASL